MIPVPSINDTTNVRDEDIGHFVILRLGGFIAYCLRELPKRDCIINVSSLLEKLKIFHVRSVSIHQ